MGCAPKIFTHIGRDIFFVIAVALMVLLYRSTIQNQPPEHGTAFALDGGACQNIETKSAENVVDSHTNCRTSNFSRYADIFNHTYTYHTNTHTLTSTLFVPRSC